jgi:hypothetical protein
MEIELLYFPGCPGHEALLARLGELLADAGLHVPVRQRRVESSSAAESERFLGSPTLRVDGVDIDSSARVRTDYGLKCRLYPTEHGLDTTPPDEWLIAALRPQEVLGIGAGGPKCHRWLGRDLGGNGTKPLVRST